MFDLGTETVAAVAVRAFMQVLEEVVVAVMFLYAGLKVGNESAPTRMALRGNRRPHLLESAFEAAVGRVHHRVEKVRCTIVTETCPPACIYFKDHVVSAYN